MFRRELKEPPQNIKVWQRDENRKKEKRKSSEPPLNRRRERQVETSVPSREREREKGFLLISFLFFLARTSGSVGRPGAF